MLGLGGMTLALTGGRAVAHDRSAGARRGAGGDAGRWQPRLVRELEREKQLVLKAIKEIEFDYQMRKIAERDYREMVERYRDARDAPDHQRARGGRRLPRADRARAEACGSSCRRPSRRRPQPAKAAAAAPAAPRPAPCAACTDRQRPRTRSSARYAARSSGARARRWRRCSLARSGRAARQPMMGGRRAGCPICRRSSGSRCPTRDAGRHRQRARRAQDAGRTPSPAWRSAPSSRTRAAICATRTVKTDAERARPVRGHGARRRVQRRGDRRRRAPEDARPSRSRPRAACAPC